MNFFKTLSETGVNDVIIQYAKEKNEITVIVSPKNIIRNNPLLQIKPIVLTGTPEEVDTKFNDVVVKALAVAQQLHDIMEANKPKEVVKPAVIPAKKKAVVKTEPTPVTTEAFGSIEERYEQHIKETQSTESLEEDFSKKEVEEVIEEAVIQMVPIIPKPVVVNNEKPLRDFMASIKDQDIINHKEKIEELYANLSEVELSKPYPKKVRIDLDIRLRKQAVIQAAKDKMKGIVPNTDINTNVLAMHPEPTPIPEAFKDMGMTEFMNATGVSKPINESIITDEMREEERLLEDKVTLAVINKSETVILPPPPKMIEVSEFVMIDTDYSKEDYMKAGWTEESLIQHLKGKMVIKQIPEVAPPAPKLGYSFPKPFDEEEEDYGDDYDDDNLGGTGHGDDSLSDADSGL